MASQLDGFDQAILDLVEEDASRSPGQIAEIVNLSASSVRRRLAALRKSGVILGQVALTDPTRKGLAFWTMVTFGVETCEAYDAFREQMRTDRAVSQCYSVSGVFDFFVMVHATSPAAFEAWGERELMSNPAIQRYTTSIIWSQTKSSARVIPVDLC